MQKIALVALFMVLLIYLFLTDYCNTIPAHRNEHLMGQLRRFSQDLKGKDPCTVKKRKKSSKKDDNMTEI
jgi:hypothetical protein